MSVATTTAGSSVERGDDQDASTLGESTPKRDFPKKNNVPDAQEIEDKLKRLDFLLSKSMTYSSILSQRLKESQEHERKRRQATTAKLGQQQPSSTKPNTAASPVRKGKKRTATALEEDEIPSKAADAPVPEGVAGDSTTLEQPPFITMPLREYQLQGVQWMLTIYENGLNGILADEMGLGKTLQTIAFIAHLKSRRVKGPILIVAPLSVLHNWEAEFQKFAPSIPVCVYHGTPQERAEIRTNALHQGSSSTSQAVQPTLTSAPNAKKSKKSASRKSAAKELSAEPSPVATVTIDPTPVFLTTYEMIIRDRAHLTPFEWRYIIVDEGHRLKNTDSILMREIKKYASTNRMILTGTPLHNNLAELWSLLNFILPDIFSDLDSFQQWFNIPGNVDDPNAPSGPILTEEHTQRVITSLHGILKPFLLRRLKSDVENNLPPKKEYVLYAPLTKSQVDLYDAIVSKNLRKYLIENIDPYGGFGTSSRRVTASKPDEEVESSSDEDEGGNRKMKLRRRDEIDYDMVSDDEVFFGRVEGDASKGSRRKAVARGRMKKQKTDAELGREFALKEAMKAVGNMSLQNVIMQCRKATCHPFLFYWPRDRNTQQPLVSKELVRASGKMMLLDRLLEALIGKNAKIDPKTKKPHKVLVFSQFTRMLDIIEDWANEQKGWATCRIDGSCGPAERRAQMEEFNNGGNSPKAPRLFLLSTRAGGLGINLVEADTVIFFDQDWNPQMDLQAQDRAHRIGQKRPVLIFRLVAAHTVDTQIMNKAGEKRKLEALVIAKGKFKVPHGQQLSKQESMAEMAATLLRLESEKIHVVSSVEDIDRNEIISDDALRELLDRSPAVFEERGKGWKAKKAHDSVVGEGAEKGAAFEVFEAAQDDSSNGLAQMMGEDD